MLKKIKISTYGLFLGDPCRNFFTFYLKMILTIIIPLIRDCD
nr:MAG TPA: Somatostatin/Cortistatin family [Caudoviricetes sp.]